MAGLITFDACSKIQGNGVSTLSGAHVLGAGKCRMLIVGLATRSTTAPFINWVRYNGVGMTYINYAMILSGADALLVQLWCMWDNLLPAAGSYNISANADISIDEGFMLFGASFFHMLQKAPVYSFPHTGTGTAFSTTWVDNLQANERIMVVGASALLQTPAMSGANAVVLNDGSVYCQGQQTAMGGILGRDQPANAGDSDTYGFTVGSSARYAAIDAEFLAVDDPYRPIQRGINSGFRRGFDRP